MLGFHSRRLLRPDGDDGGTTPTAPLTPTTPSTQPAPTPKPAAPASSIVPPAAHIVATGKKNESDVLPEITKRKLETRISELEDENFRLKQTPAPPAPTPAQPEKEHWLKGWPFD